jgi:type IV secretory pathway TraG/TraD family ATPase VirD4
MDMDVNKSERKIKLLIILASVAFTLLLALWLATQKVAARCDYDPLLGMALYSGADFKLYFPWDYLIWCYKFGAVIPNILSSVKSYFVVALAAGILLAVFINKQRRFLSSHGTASWAKAKDIKKTGLSAGKGVILGWNPYKRQFLQHDGPQHILLLAPTRSGKGVGVIIPTCLTWPHSMLVTDVKAENWNFSALYRRKALKNRVLKFEPFNVDGTGAKWNPLAEIRYRTEREFGDVQILAGMLANPSGKEPDGNAEHWVTTAAALITTVIIHLLYKHHQIGKLPPTMADISTFLSLPHNQIINEMEMYAHISPIEFFSKDNILANLESKTDDRLYFDIFALREKLAADDLSEEEKSHVWNLQTLADVQEYVKKKYAENPDIFNNVNYAALLNHPKVAEGAREMKNRDPKEESSVLSSAAKAFTLYRNSVVARNTSGSDFKIADLLNPQYPVSVFLVTSPGDLDTVKPLFRLFMGFILKRNTEKMSFKKDEKKQRCLLLFDEFPQFGRLEAVELALAVMAGYGLKALLVSQDINQLNKAYTKDNSIVANCHVRVFYTPNEDASAEMISKSLGKQTIKVQSQNSGNGGIGSGSYSTSEIARDLMTPDEVKRLPYEKELVFVAGEKAIMGDKLFYFKEKYFTEKIAQYGEANEQYVKSDTVTQVKSYTDIMEQAAVMPVLAWELAEMEKQKKEAEKALETISMIETENKALAAAAQAKQISQVPEPADNIQDSGFEEDDGYEEKSIEIAGSLERKDANERIEKTAV